MQNVPLYTEIKRFSTKKPILWKVKLVFYSFNSYLSACTYKLRLCFLYGTRDPAFIIILGHARRQSVGPSAA